MTSINLEQSLLDRMDAVSFPTLGHFLENGFAEPAIRALVPNVKIVGRAVTLKLVNADAIAMNRALADLAAGDVLVIDMCGDHTHAPVGAVTGCAALNAGAKAIVVDGVVTDILELRAMGMPVFARGTSLLTTKRLDAAGNLLNQPVKCGGVIVNPGDVVIADDNGVLFLDAATAASVVDKALASDRAEPALLARLHAGEAARNVLTLGATHDQHSPD
jgi:regulator of RNase E activity RraA